MKVSESANRLRAIIEKAIEDHKITRAEYEKIIHLSLEDSHIDSQERALLSELQEMVSNKTIRMVP